MAAIAIVFLLGLRRPPPSIRRHQVSPDPAVLLCVIAVSISLFPLSSPPRSRVVAVATTMAEAIAAAAPRRRGQSHRSPCLHLPPRSVAS